MSLLLCAAPPDAQAALGVSSLANAWLCRRQEGREVQDGPAAAPRSPHQRCCASKPATTPLTAPHAGTVATRWHSMLVAPTGAGAGASAAAGADSSAGASSAAKVWC